MRKEYIYIDIFSVFIQNKNNNKGFISCTTQLTQDDTQLLHTLI